MVGLNVTIDGDKVLIQGLTLADRAIVRGGAAGLERVTVGIFDEAHKLLSGQSRSRLRIFTRAQTYNIKTRKRTRTKMRGVTDQLGAAPGSYPPVPVVTGHLRRYLNFIKPGESKSDNGYSFSAGPLEAIVYNSARYASVISEGTYSSEKYGPRPFDTDAVKNYDQGGHIAAIIDEEVQKAIDAAGLG